MKPGDKIILVAGARPNFVKAAALERAFSKAGFEVCLVHTGQHYDKSLSNVFFEQLEIPKPDHHLEIGSGSHGRQTGRIMAAFEPVLEQERPELVAVVGDVNSTLACALVTAKMVYPDGHRPGLAHVEAGLRSFDRTMPEEINRLATDHVSHLLFASEQAGVDNLLAEGIAKEKIHLVGNVMIDTLTRLIPKAEQTRSGLRFDPVGRRYGLVTLHRPHNVDDPKNLTALMEILCRAGDDIPLLMAAHPRTMKTMEQAGLKGFSEPSETWIEQGGLAVTGPLPYLDFLALMKNAALVLTDSGGIQEETTAMSVPCLTLRPNTERPVTISQGTNRLVTDFDRLLTAVRETLADPPKGRTPQLWDGRAAERVAGVLLKLE